MLDFTKNNVKEALEYVIEQANEKFPTTIPTKEHTQFEFGKIAGHYEFKQYLVQLYDKVTRK